MVVLWSGEEIAIIKKVEERRTQKDERTRFRTDRGNSSLKTGVVERRKLNLYGHLRGWLKPHKIKFSSEGNVRSKGQDFNEFSPLMFVFYIRAKKNKHNFWSMLE